MNIFLLVSDKEAKYIKKGAKVVKRHNDPCFKMLELEKNDKHIGLVITMIGKVHAGAALVAAINTFGKNNNFINAGTCGSLDGNVANVLDAVIGSKFVQYDVDTTAIGDPLGMISGPNIVYFESSDKLNSLIEKGCKRENIKPVYGIISTGDKFVSSKEEKERIKSSFSSLLIEMETGAIAEIAYSYKVRFSAFKVITDVNDEKEYFANFDAATKLVGKLVWSI